MHAPQVWPGFFFRPPAADRCAREVVESICQVLQSKRPSSSNCKWSRERIFVNKPSSFHLQKPSKMLNFAELVIEVKLRTVYLEQNDMKSLNAPEKQMS